MLEPFPQQPANPDSSIGLLDREAWFSSDEISPVDWHKFHPIALPWSILSQIFSHAVCMVLEFIHLWPWKWLEHLNSMTGIVEWLLLSIQMFFVQNQRNNEQLFVYLPLSLNLNKFAFSLLPCFCPHCPILILPLTHWKYKNPTSIELHSDKLD